MSGLRDNQHAIARLVKQPAVQAELIRADPSTERIYESQRTANGACMAGRMQGTAKGCHAGLEPFA